MDGLDVEIPPALLAAVKDALRDLVHQLVVGNFSGLYTEGRTGDITAEELQAAVARYPGTLIDLPDQAWPYSDATAIKGEHASWSIVISLWTAQEGRSDLNMVTNMRAMSEGIKVIISDLDIQ